MCLSLIRLIDFLTSGTVLLYQHSGCILQDLHSRHYLQDFDLVGLLKFRLQSHHLLDLQHGIPRGVQADLNRTIPGLVQVRVPIGVTE